MPALRTAGLLAALALLTLAAPAAAQPLEPAHLLSASGAEDDRVRPAIAGGGDRTLAVWERRVAGSEPVRACSDALSRAPGAGVEARVTDGFGAPQGAVTTIATGDAGDPDVAWSATSQSFLAVYTRAAGGVFARRVGRDGQPLGDEVTIAGGEACGPAVAWSATRDQHLVVWTTGDGTIQARAVSGAGVALGSDTAAVAPFADSGDGGYERVRADVVHDDGADRWLVADLARLRGFPGRGAEEGPIETIIEVAVLDGDLNQLSGPTEVVGGPIVATGVLLQDFAVRRRFLALAPRGPGQGALLAYTNAREQIFIDTLRLAADGTPEGGGEGAGGPEQSASDPALAREGTSGQYLLTFDRNQPSGREQAARVLGPDGAPAGPVQDISTGTRREGGGDVAWVAATCTWVPAWEGVSSAEDREGPSNVRARGFDAPDCPRREESPPLQPQPQQPQQQTQSQQQPRPPVALPRRCRSRRSFRIRVRRFRGRRYVSAQVRVNGRLVRTVLGRRVTAPVRLTGLPRGRFTVTIVARTADGRRFRGTRRYRTCVPRRPGGVPLL